MTDDVLAPTDLELLRRASTQLAEAQAIAAFVERHLHAVYELRADDRVDMQSGAISRAEADG